MTRAIINSNLLKIYSKAVQVKSSFIDIQYQNKRERSGHLRLL